MALSLWVMILLIGFFFFFFHLGFMDYFTHFELSQSLGEIPKKKTPDHPQAEFGLFHMWPELELI